MTSTNRHDAQSPTRSGGGAAMDDPISAQIEREVAGCAGVRVEPHRSGGIELKVGRRELGTADAANKRCVEAADDESSTASETAEWPVEKLVDDTRLELVTSALRTPAERRAICYQRKDIARRKGADRSAWDQPVFPLGCV